ncbi:hypothetical protein QTP70_017632, partial [Hemibagrus guttatus]
QTEILKKDFRSLVELVRTTSPTTRIIVSGPFPTFQRGIERTRIYGFIKFFWVKQNITRPTHRFNHTLDLVISHGTDVTDIAVVTARRRRRKKPDPFAEPAKERE